MSALPAVVAHRGASAAYPENTLSAIRAAVSSGVDLVELDVQRSRDGALVVMHDRTLVRTTNVQTVFPTRASWRLADFSYDELMRLDAGSWKSQAFAGERVPTLEQAIDVLRESDTGLLLELKAPELYPGIVTDVATTLRLMPMSKVVVQSFDVAAMKDHKTQLPDLPVGLLGAPPVANLPVLATWADQVNPNHLSVDHGYVERVQDLGMECLVWTVDRGMAMKRALGMGVDGVITNRPDDLAQLLARSGRPARTARNRGRRARWAVSP